MRSISARRGVSGRGLRKNNNKNNNRNNKKKNKKIKK